MNKITILFILCGLLAFSPIAAQQKYGRENRPKNPPPQVVDQKEIRTTALYIEATSAFITENYKKAEKLYVKVLEQNPHDHAAMYQLARIYLYQEQDTQALNYALKAHKEEKKNPWYLQLLSEIYQKERNYDEAAKTVEKLVKTAPKDPDYRWQLANLYLFAERYHKALKEFHKMEEILGVNEEISTRKIKIYEHLHKKEKVLNELKKLASAHPQEVRYLAMLAEKLMHYEREEEAFVYYQKIAQLNPSDPYIHITLAEYYRKTGHQEKAFQELKEGFTNNHLDIDTKIQILMAYYSVSEIYENLNPQAYQLLQILTEQHPESPKTWSMYGDFLYRDQRYQEAAQAYQKVLVFDKSKYLVWESLMHALLAINDYQQLLNTTNEAIELFPYQPLPLLFAGFSHIHQKSYDKAIAVLESGLKLVIDNPSLKSHFYSSLGDAYHAIKETDKAFQAYDKSLLLDPENSYVLNNYSYYLSLEKRELEKAEIMAQKAVEIDPENPSNLDTYGWVLFQQEKYEEAQKYIFQALKKSTTPDPDVLEHYGDVMDRLGEKSSAKMYWQKAIDAGNDKEELMHKLKSHE